MKVKKIGTNKVIGSLLEYVDRHELYMDYYSGCSEHGYDDKPVIAANWNEGRLAKIGKWLERFYSDEISVEWSDEWTGCNECNKAIRTSLDSYSWTPSYMWISGCEIVCHEHYKDMAEELIEEYSNTTRKAVPYDFYPILEKKGFICYSPDEYCKKFETGWHPNQDDDPKKVAKEIEKELPDYDYVFKIDNVGQFDVQWSVFLRRKENEK